MFEAIKDYLNSMTFEQKEEMIRNLKEFARLKTFLEAKEVLVKGEKPDELWIVKKHPDVQLLKDVYHKMTLQGVKLIDKTGK